MPPPEEEEGQGMPQEHLLTTNMGLKLEPGDLVQLHADIQNNEHYEESEDHFNAEGTDEGNYKADNMEINHFENEEEHFESQDDKNAGLIDNIIEGNTSVTFENINSSGFEEQEPMQTEVSAQSSHQESFFSLPCEKREINQNSILSDANMITESDEAFETYESELMQQTEEQSELKAYVSESQPVTKTYYYKQDAEEEDIEEEEEEEETILQSEEYFQEEQPTDSNTFTEEPVFVDSSFQNIEEYESSEQVIETTESEIPAEYINETVDSVQSIVSEETIPDEGESKSHILKTKTVLSKDSVLQLNQSNVSMKKIVADHYRSVQSPLKRPLLPGPGQSKNIMTKVIIQQGNSNSTGTGNQPFKIIGSAGSSMVTGQTKTISFAQAQQMGLISPGAKIHPILPSGSSGGQKRMIVKKILPTCSSSLLTPSTTSKSPTKILPAPSPMKGSNIRPSVSTIRGPVSVANIQTIRGNMPVGTLKTIPSLSNRPIPVAAITALRQSGLSNVTCKPVGTVKNVSGTQKVIIRQGQIPLKGGTIINPSNTGQVIRIPAGVGAFQPIQIGSGKQVQYVRLVSGSGSTLPTTVINNAKSKIVKTPMGQTAFKAVPIAPNPNTSIKTVLPKPTVSVATSSATAKRILIPVSQGMSQFCIANDVSATSSDDGDSEKSITTVPVSTLQQLKSTGSITAIPASAVAHLRQGRNITTLTNSQFAQLKNVQAVKSDSGIIPVSQSASEGSFVMSEGSIVMLPPEVIQQIQSGDVTNGDAAAEATEAKSKSTSEGELNDEENYDKENVDNEGRRSTSPGRILEANGIRMKKPCNCTRSQCLKLYCECFANGEFCFQCNCNNCFNNIEHEEERQRSIKSCLERNPSAFRPKIQIGETEEDERRHNKGCHCKRSGCLKNYCECYEAKITCSKSCKCIGCRNTEEFLEGSRSGLIDLADAAEESFNSEQKSEFVLRPQSTNSSLKQPYNFMSSEVVEATCQCLLAQAEEAERNGLSTEEGERLIIEEFGRCLVQIIGCSNVDDNTAR